MTVGWRAVPIAKLRLPGDWKKVLDDPSIASRAASQRLVGIIHEPVVRESDMKLLAGRRRVAAALHNGEEEVTCKLVECTDDEGELLGLMENAYREHSSEEQKRLVDLLAPKIALLQGKESILEPNRKKGKLKLPRTLAREVIRQETGRTKEAQRKAEQRVEKRHEELKANADHDADIGIRSPWADLDPDFRRKTNQVVKAVHECSQLLSRTLGRLTVLVDSGLPVSKGRFNRMREELQLVSNAVRGLMPFSLCPFCKGIEEVMEAPCGGCHGTGYITQDQEKGVPAELWLVGDEAVVMFQGRKRPYDSFFAQPAPKLIVHPIADVEINRVKALEYLEEEGDTIETDTGIEVETTVEDHDAIWGDGE